MLGILDKMYKEEIASEAYHDWFMQYMSPGDLPGLRRQTAEAVEPGGARAGLTIAS